MAEAGKPNEAKSQDVDDLPSFTIPLAEGIGDGANFHTVNDLKDPWQRYTVVERNGRIAVSCRTLDIVHGFYSEKDDEEDEDQDQDEGQSQDEEDETPQHCSLIVLHFRFDPNDLDRRVKKVKILATFSAIESDDDDPVVDKIHPDGFFWVYPTTQKETLQKRAAAKAGGNVFGAEVGGELARDKTVERDVTNAGTVRGAIQTEGRNHGLPNTAAWTLMENTTDETGAPVSLRAAILVKREHVNFQAHFTIKVTPDNLTRVQTIFKSNPKDDPVLYNVDKRPTNKLRRYDKEILDEKGEKDEKDEKDEKGLSKRDVAHGRLLVNNLGLLDLESPEFSDITCRTIWKDSQKSK